MRSIPGQEDACCPVGRDLPLVIESCGSAVVNLATAVTVIDACGCVHVPVLLISDPSMGKSSLVRGLAAAQGVPCEMVLGSSVIEG